MYKLRWTPIARKTFEELHESDFKKWKKVKKALGFLESDPSHNSLHSHKYHSVTGPDGEEMFEAYAENNNPSPWRIFFYYPNAKKGEKKPEKIIVVYALLRHP